MKRILCVILSLVFAIGVCACANEETGDTASPLEVYAGDTYVAFEINTRR